MARVSALELQVLPCAHNFNSSSDRLLLQNRTADFATETELLTKVCQQQINYWHNKRPFTEEQISAVMKYAKHTIVTRERGSRDFVRYLRQGNIF